MNDSSRQIVVYSLLWAGPPSWERVYSGSRQPWWIASSCKNQWGYNINFNYLMAQSHKWYFSLILVLVICLTRSTVLADRTRGTPCYLPQAVPHLLFYPVPKPNSLVPLAVLFCCAMVSWCLRSLRKADYIYCVFSFARIKQLSGHLSPLKFSYTAMVLCKFCLNRGRKRVFCFACFSFPRAVRKAIFLKHKLITQLLLSLWAKPGINTLPCYTKACLYWVTIPLNKGKCWTGRKSKSKLIRK